MANIPSGTQFHAVSPSVNTQRLRSQLLNSYSDSYTIEDISSSVGIGGTNYIYVMANGTDTENAAELQSAYTTAATMSPSATNRITIVCGPGKYNFGSSAFVMNTQYIDLVSLDGNRSVIFNSSNAAGTISITANDVFVKGVDVGTKSFTIGSNLNLLKVENCKGGDYSFGGQQSGSYGIVLTVSGTFIDCEGGDFCFGATGYLLGGTVTASGTFINCKGGELSFGNEGFGTGNTGFASGIFKNCVVVGYNGFAGYYGVASGTFENCASAQQGFGTSGIASGLFTNCVGGIQSFGGGGTLTGKLYYCRLTSGAFQTVSGGGVTRLCLNGSNVENNQG